MKTTRYQFAVMLIGFMVAQAPVFGQDRSDLGLEIWGRSLPPPAVQQGNISSVCLQDDNFRGNSDYPGVYYLNVNSDSIEGTAVFDSFEPTCEYQVVGSQSGFLFAFELWTAQTHCCAWAMGNGRVDPSSNSASGRVSWGCPDGIHLGTISWRPCDN